MAHLVAHLAAHLAAHRLDVAVRITAVAAALLGANGCAHTQTVFLDCVPKDVTIYLDRVPLDQVPEFVDLRTDQPHVLFFKGEGYEPTMVVLEIDESADEPALSPSDVCLDLNLAKRKRELEIEIAD